MNTAEFRNLLTEQNTQLKAYINSQFIDFERNLGHKLNRLEAEIITLKTETKEIQEEIKNGFLGIADAFDRLGKDIDIRFANHDQRITWLEQRTA